jgi:endonuclease-3
MDTRDQHQTLLAEVSARLTEYFGTRDIDFGQSTVETLVLTYLSQNTNDINRDKAYAALRAKYASWEAVRDADPDELIDCIRVAGLANQKGPNIQAGLRAISEHAGEINLDFLRELEVEEARAWLTHLRGVGPKTAAIVLVFSLGMPAFPVDTHVYRVSGRIGFRPQALDVVKTQSYLESIGDPSQFGPLHLNVIRLGREICQARKPKCPVCPVIDLCQYQNKTK